MTLETLVREVAIGMNVPEEAIEKAVLWARITAPDSASYTRKDMSKSEEHMARMLFRAVLHRIATDPEYKRSMEKEMQERIQRN